jgi:hypothetical protein
MKLFAQVIIFAIFFFKAQAQPYHITKEISTGEWIKPGDDILKISFKVYRDTLFQTRVINKDNEKYNLKLTSFNLESGQKINCDTILGLPNSFNIEDFTFNKGKVLITAYNKFICFNFNNMSAGLFSYPENLEDKKEPCRFSNCHYINDSLILLSIIYDYHPVDARGGVYLRMFNVNSKQFGNCKFIKIPGIAVSHMFGNWVTVIKEHIYISLPLTGKLYVLDKEFKEVDSVSLPIFNVAEYAENIQYQSYLDFVIDSETTRILNITSKYPPDSVKLHRSEYTSAIYGKDFFSNTIRDTRQKHTYIENVIPVDDSLIYFSVSQPGYATKFRDIFIYDPTKKKIVKKYPHFQCNHSDSLTKPEDFFTINFAIGRLCYPYIHNGYVYSPSLHSLSSFQTGKFDDLSLKLFNATKQAGYKWTIYKYILE